MVGGPRRLLAAALFASVVTGCTKNTIQSALAPTPAPPPTPAPIARLAVSVSGTDGLVALAGQSVVTVDARGSSGTGLRYGLDFGDGSGAEEARATHIYTASGRVHQVRVVVTDAVGRTDTAAVSVSVADTRGRWSHTFYNPRPPYRSESRELRITGQANGALTGFYRHPEGAETPLKGELVGERGFRVYSPDGFIEFSSTDEGISASGLIVRMNVRGGSADGLTLLFSRTGLAAP